MVRLKQSWLMVSAVASLAAACSGDAATTAANVAQAKTAINNEQRPQAAGLDRAAFLAQCRRETLRSDSAAGSYVDQSCRSRWSDAQALLPLADAVLRLAPAPGASAPTVAQARATLPPVDWDDASLGGDARGLNAHVVLGERQGAVRHIGFSSVHSGSDTTRDDPVVESLADAFIVRGGRLSNIGCSEDGDAISRVDAAGHASFVLETGQRPQMMGDTSYWASVFFTDSIPDLAALRAGRWTGVEGSNVEPAQWRATCPAQ